MREQIEVIYENGVLRPISGVPSRLHEHQQLTLTIDDSTAPATWLAGADPTVSLESVRTALGKAPTTLAQMIHAEREER